MAEGRLCTVQSRHNTDTASRPPTRSLLVPPARANCAQKISIPQAAARRGSCVPPCGCCGVAHDARVAHLRMLPRLGRWRLQDEPCHHLPPPDRRLMSRLDQRPADGSMDGHHQSPDDGCPSVPLAADGCQLDSSSPIAVRMSAVSVIHQRRGPRRASTTASLPDGRDLVAGSRRRRPSS